VTFGPCVSSPIAANIQGVTPSLTADWLSADIGADKQMDTTPFDDITYRIIGAAMKVHNGLGPGLKEAFYQRALSLEMEEAGLGFSAEHAVEVHLNEVQVGLLYLDHLVEDEVVVEAKALPHMLTDEEKAQVITYLAATGKKVGLLINFGRGSLEYKRILPPRDITTWSARIRRYVWVPRQQRFGKSVAPPVSAYPLSNSLTVSPLSGSTPLGPSTPLPGKTPRP
jgi:GxxExxY protein